MSTPADILLDNDLDIKIVDGDFAIGDSTYQNQKLLLICGKNDVKQYPSACVGLDTYLDDESPADMHRAIRMEFTGDGMKVKSIKTIEGKINIDAPYDID